MFVMRSIMHKSRIHTGTSGWSYNAVWVLFNNTMKTYCIDKVKTSESYLKNESCLKVHP
jgi:hypothetical protein